MSKIYDVEKMYGQDFSIVTTNAPSNIIKQAKKLLSNTLLISSPENETGDADNNMPSIFVTDYNAQPLQLTYPFYMKNGLNYHENGYVYINIDDSTIKTENLNGTGKLKVDTNNLSSATFNKKGVVKLSNTLQDINRNLKEDYNLQDSISKKYNESTFITVNNEGILYIHNDLFNLINSIVDLKIKQKMDSIKVMLNSNLKVWIYIKYINGNYVGDSNTIYNVGMSSSSVLIDNNQTTSMTFDLHYLSFNPNPENIQIVDSTNKIYSISLSDNYTKVQTFKDNDELYEHVLSNISIIFLPNYFIENNEIYKQELPINFNIGNDKSETLIFQQDKLSNYSIDIQLDNYSENPSISMNEILNTNSIYSIKEKILLDGFKGVSINGDSIIEYKINSFIVNNSDESNNYDLSTTTIIEPSSDGDSIYLSNKDNEGVYTQLYNFIKNIIDQDDEGDLNNIDSNSTQYEIQYNGVLPNGNNTNIIISDLVERISNNNEDVQYRINLGTNIIILTANNKEIGKYYKKIPIYLDRNKTTIYGYIYITSANLNGNSNQYPKHIYYQNRNSNTSDRLYLNNQSGYSGSTINPLKLYCIFSDINNISGENYNTIYIPFANFKQYNINDANNQDTDITDNINVEFSNQNITRNTNNIQISLSNSDLLSLLNDGMTFNINYNNSNSNSSIIKSQTIEMNINTLELLLTNLSITNSDNNNSILISPSHIINTTDYSNSQYYNMNHYVVKKTINNTNILQILVKIPKCIKTVLSGYTNLKLLMNLYFYVVNSNNNAASIKKETIYIEFNSSTNSINASLDNSDSLISINNNVVINNSTIDGFIIENKTQNTILPKLLMIGYQFDNDDNSEKICYIQDTRISIGGDIFIPSGNTEIYTNKKLYSNTSNNITIYDITTVVNTVTSNSVEKSNIIKDLLKAFEFNSSDICVNNIDISGYILSFDNSLNISTNKFSLLVDNNKLYYDESINFGERYNIKFKYNYLPQIDGLMNYNEYSNTPIEGQNIIISNNNQIRFNSILFYDNGLSIQWGWPHPDGVNYDGNLWAKKSADNVIDIKICTTDTSNTSNNFLSSQYIRTSILPILFKADINKLDGNTNSSNIFNYIDFYLNENDNNHESTPLVAGNEYKLYLKGFSLNSNYTVQKLFLGYSIRINIPSWDGITVNNNNTYDIVMTEGETFNIEINNNNLPLYYDIQPNQKGLISNLLNTINSIGYDNQTYDFKIYIDLNNSQDNPKYVDFKHPIRITKQNNGYTYTNIGLDKLYFSHLPENDTNHSGETYFTIDDRNSQFYLYYDESIMSSPSLKVGDIPIGNSNCPIEQVGTETSTTITIEGNTNTYKKRVYQFTQDAGNHQTYVLSCSVIGKDDTTNQIYYYDKTLQCSITLNIPDPILIPETAFSWPNYETTITDMNSLLDGLPTITNTTGQQVNYSCEVIEQPSGSQLSVSEIRCDSGQNGKSINISGYTSGYAKIKIYATIDAYNNYLTTTRETYLILNVPNTSE